MCSCCGHFTTWIRNAALLVALQILCCTGLRVGRARFDGSHDDIAPDTIRQADEWPKPKWPMYMIPQFVTHELHLPFETHNITTSRGYHLCNHRLPNEGGKPVFLMHPTGASSATWFLPRRQSVPAILHDHGYDVWLGNLRGNYYSQGHRSLSMSDPDFWDWTIIDAGAEDLPEILEYILMVTKHSSISYVGSSIGTTMLWGALARPESSSYVNPIINLNVAFAPVLCGFAVPGLLKYMRHDTLLEMAAGQSEGPHNMNTQQKVKAGLRKQTFEEHWLEKLFNTTTMSHLVESAVGYIAGHIAGTSDLDLTCETACFWDFAGAEDGLSSKMYVHAAQQLRYNTTMHEYDYGELGNLVAYSQPTAPIVNLSNARVPTALFFAKNDQIIGDPRNFEIVRKSLANSPIVWDKVYSGYSHVTFFQYDHSKRYLDQNFYKDDLLRLLAKAGEV
eukprot:gnl/TRDRNA2_/TRDRNA2_161283_c1_seq3.p1 gnl/TRDRNA2_/TRDRNA2_161283_c1~~gnl/TRDRNA2_/TRDRNA2_161283_c1_seq3.p1  ORF type:complete len:448 (+),score=45.98 gnl/TRDRNA2_/TRDRNA2_161283_c1_seq3:73-1416(+)